MKCPVVLALATAASAFLLSVGAAEEQPAFHRVPANVVKNASFEENWYNRAFAMNRRFLLLQGSDMGVGEADGHVDHWRFRGVQSPECWDLAVARGGSRSVRLDGAGSASQLVRFAGEQYWVDGGAYYNYFIPMRADLALRLTRRPIVVGAWCRTERVPAGGEPQLVVSIECATRTEADKPTARAEDKVRASAAFSAGSHGWEYREVRIVPKKLAAVTLETAEDRGDTLEDEVSLLGSRTDVGAILAAADVFVLSTRSEVFSVATLEALAAGVPVVTSDVPGFEEVFANGREGLRVPPGEPAALADAVERLLDDADVRERLALEGRRRAGRFAMSRMAGNFERLLTRLCR